MQYFFSIILFKVRTCSLYFILVNDLFYEIRLEAMKNLCTLVLSWLSIFNVVLNPSLINVQFKCSLQVWLILELPQNESVIYGLKWKVGRLTLSGQLLILRFTVLWIELWSWILHLMLTMKEDLQEKGSIKQLPS